MAYIKLATYEQRKNYYGVYPLHGYTKIDGIVCYVEDLRSMNTPGDPSWELRTPHGYRFADGPVHGILGDTQATLLERAQSTYVERCDEDCPCGKGQKPRV